MYRGARQGFTQGADAAFQNHPAAKAMFGALVQRPVRVCHGPHVKSLHTCCLKAANLVAMVLQSSKHTQSVVPFHLCTMHPAAAF